MSGTGDELEKILQPLVEPKKKCGACGDRKQKLNRMTPDEIREALEELAAELSEQKHDLKGLLKHMPDVAAKAGAKNMLLLAIKRAEKKRRQ